MSRFFAALYVSEGWYDRWRRTGSVYAKARAMVLFDRILLGGEHRMRLNGAPLDKFLDQP